MGFVEPALRRGADNPGLMIAGMGSYLVTLALNSDRLRVVREPGNVEIFNRVKGVNEISDWVTGLEHQTSVLMKLGKVGNHQIIWLYDPTDEDNFGIGINLTTRELTDWGPTP